MNPRFLFLDFEGTGTDPLWDRIVEACFYCHDSGCFTTRVNPERSIPAEATAVHGITDEDVADAPYFREIAPRVQQLVTGRVLVGYNIRRYDTLLLDAELRRAGQAGLPRGADGRLQIPEIDLYQLWQRSEPRTLAGAAKRFAGVDLGDTAHSAEVDTLVLVGTLEGMIQQLGLGDDVEALCALCIPDGEMDRDGKFRRREDGVVVFNFTQQKGQPVADHPDLLSWILSRDFSQETKAVARALLEEIYAPARAEAEQGAFL